MFTFIVKGGPVMIPIIIGSIFGLAIVLERFWVFRQKRRKVENIFKRWYLLILAIFFPLQNIINWV